MGILCALLSDESGTILSAEAVVLGSVLLVGATTGLNAVSQSVNSELSDFAAAITELDQSYTVEPAEFENGWSAGSNYADLEETETTNTTNEVCLQFEDTPVAERIENESSVKSDEYEDLNELELKYVK